jgi:undecaprenyl-diphosphatase
MPSEKELEKSSMSLHEIDIHSFFFVNKNLQNSIFDVIMPFITDRYYLLIFALAIWLAVKEKKNVIAPVLIAILSIALSDWVSNMLKHLIERPRPFIALESVKLLVGQGGSFSMPSSHAANSAAIIFSLSFRAKRWVMWSILAIALLVSFSRVYIGVHYPSDVIVGAVVGIIVSLFVIQMYKWSEFGFRSKPFTTMLLISLIGFSLLRIYYITRGIIDLSPDEAHYWEWSRRLDLSYYSKGPMVAYLIAIGTAIFGNSVFGIRILAVIFYALSSIFLYLLGKKLFDEKTGVAAAILIQIVPLYTTYGVLFTIDSPFIFFWILSLYLFYRVIEQQSAVSSQQSAKLETLNSKHPPQSPLDKGGIKGGYWLLLGIVVGLGLLTKYTMAFFYLCAFLFLLSSYQNRKLLLTKWPYISLVLSLIVFSPVIFWNANHDWVTLKHTAGQAHISSQWSVISDRWVKDFFEFLGSQIGVITPILFIMIFYAIFKLRTLPLELKTKNSKLKTDFLFWFSVPIILFFLLKSLQGKVQANWALPGYATGFVAFSWLFIGRWELTKRWLRSIIVVGVVFSFIASSASYVLPFFELPPKRDPSSRIRGWKEVGAEVSRLSDELSKKGPFFIFSDRYQVSSELAFYIKGNPVTYCMNMGRRMNQYDLWPGFNNLIHFNALFVTIGDMQIPEIFSRSFDRCEKNNFNVYSGEIKLREYSILTCYDFKGLEQREIESY